MGKASKGKWLRRLQAMESNLSQERSRRDSPWHQGVWFIFWLSIFGTAIFTAVPMMVRSYHWLFGVAWLSASLALWIAIKNMITGKPRVRVGIFILGTMLVACGLYGLYRQLDPSYVTDSQLCSKSQAFAQRMRDFEYQQNVQHDGVLDELRKRISAAKTEMEKSEIAKQEGEYIDKWLIRLQQDFNSALLAQAKSLKHELLSRLPPQPKANYIDEGEAFNGMLVGTRPIANAADRLDMWAGNLCP